ncbi:MAG: hypothetical protein AAF447_01065 [Myxococcota bacterium]
MRGGRCGHGEREERGEEAHGRSVGTRARAVNVPFVRGTVPRAAGLVLAVLLVACGEEPEAPAEPRPGEDPVFEGPARVERCQLIRHGTLATEGEAEDLRVDFLADTAAVAWREGRALVLQRLRGIGADGPPLRMPVPDFDGHALAALRGGLLHVSCARCEGSLRLCVHARALAEDGGAPRGPEESAAAASYGCALESLEATSPGSAYDDVYLALGRQTTAKGPRMLLRRFSLAPDGMPRIHAPVDRPLAPPLPVLEAAARGGWTLRPEASDVGNLIIERSPLGLAFFGRVRLAQQRDVDGMTQEDPRWFMAFDFRPAVFTEDIGRLAHAIARRPDGLVVLASERRQAFMRPDGTLGELAPEASPPEDQRPVFTDLPRPFDGVLHGLLREGDRDTRFVRRDLRGHRVDDVGLGARAPGATFAYDGIRALIAHARPGAVRLWEVACAEAD